MLNWKHKELPKFLLVIGEKLNAFLDDVQKKINERNRRAHRLKKHYCGTTLLNPLINIKNNELIGIDLDAVQPFSNTDQSPDCRPLERLRTRHARATE